AADGPGAARDPDRARPVCDGYRTSRDPDRERCVRARIDPRDRVIPRVCDPDCRVSEGDARRSLADRNRAHRTFLEGRGVETSDVLVATIRNPEGVVRVHEAHRAGPG